MRRCQHHEDREEVSWVTSDAGSSTDTVRTSVAPQAGDDGARSGCARGVGQPRESSYEYREVGGERLSLQTVTEGRYLQGLLADEGRQGV